MACAFALVQSATAQNFSGNSDRLSFAFRDMPVADVFQMLSKQERVNIILSRNITGTVNVNLYDMTLPHAIRAIAQAAGYEVEERGNTFLVVERKDNSKSSPGKNTGLHALRVQYSNLKQVAEIVAKYASPEGKVSLMEDRRLIIIEDTTEVASRIESLVKEIDRQPVQIMIEARILEIGLDDSQTFGVDWQHVFGGGERSRVGTQGVAARSSPGLFFNIVNKNIDIYLNALSSKGKVRTLATPKLLTLEDQEAVTNVGDKLGYRVTTTINNVTTESIQFIETGIILRVTPSVDASGRIAMKIKPEVSSGSISGGIPSKKTTEVTTQFVAENGQSILIAGLIKNTEGYRRTGVPVLGEFPGIGRLFSSTEQVGQMTETVVVITPRIVEGTVSAEHRQPIMQVQNAEQTFDQREKSLKMALDFLQPPAARGEQAEP